ncbi:riboflavin-specific deaminase/GTP cyclohydrolase II [Thraustotheca clavata]|uniref:Riboflavin-specific deaminase/GTP cyclohydrolase II n=1 Tax=Thraustotheca clavata TaxID=74557 RepID=A0A1V9ZJQ4_9STRA|nr:riboflavin-specific deaminase/GTP cyclohydrolase II [Thraustotheca clavata]
MNAIENFHAAGVASITDRLFVTLTYAQSLDGCISAVPGKPTLLSGQRSMTMTHQLRVLHDGILVGVGTIKADNPSLTVRLILPPFQNPQPIVVDAMLEIPHTCKLFTSNKRPWILTVDNNWDDEKLNRKQLLEALGARVIKVASKGKPHYIDFHDAFEKLYWLGLKSVMIEGGASIITSCLHQQNTSSISVIDHVIVTVAPVYVGGLHAVAQPLHYNGLLRLQNIKSTQLGQDVIIFGSFSA